MAKVIPPDESLAKLFDKMTIDAAIFRQVDETFEVFIHEPTGDPADARVALDASCAVLVSYDTDGMLPEITTANALRAIAAVLKRESEILSAYRATIRAFGASLAKPFGE